MGGDVEFRALGPLDVEVEGRSATPGSRQLRLLLTALLVDAGKVVSGDRLAYSLWGDAVPEDAQSRVGKLVYRLRSALAPAARDAIETMSPGYLLHVGDGYDVTRFEVRFSDARARLARADYGGALACLDEALGLWRGPAFAEFADDDFARAEAGRLEDLRVTAMEERVSAKLSLGRHDEVIPELEKLVTAHPFRERLWGDLMLALYRSGRQSEALRAYQDVRQKLADELGIEPGESLRELEGAILRHDPELTPPMVTDAEPPARDDDLATLSAPSHSRRRLFLVGGVAVLVVLAFLGVGALTLSSDDGATDQALPKKLTLPYEAKLVETLDGNSSGSTVTGVITGAFVGHGTYTGLTHTTEAPPVCSVGVGIPTTTSTIITAENGDTLRQDETGILCMRPPTSFEFAGRFRFSGGSGCFEGVKGGGQITAKIAFADATFSTGQATSRDIGSIKLMRKPHCPQTK